MDPLQLLLKKKNTRQTISHHPSQKFNLLVCSIILAPSEPFTRKPLDSSAMSSSVAPTECPKNKNTIASHLSLDRSCQYSQVTTLVLTNFTCYSWFFRVGMLMFFVKEHAAVLGLDRMKMALVEIFYGIGWAAKEGGSRRQRNECTKWSLSSGLEEWLQGEKEGGRDR